MNIDNYNKLYVNYKRKYLYERFRRWGSIFCQLVFTTELLAMCYLWKTIYYEFISETWKDTVFWRVVLEKNALVVGWRELLKNHFSTTNEKKFSSRHHSASINQRSLSTARKEDIRQYQNKHCSICACCFSAQRQQQYQWLTLGIRLCRLYLKIHCQLTTFNPKKKQS